MKIFFAVLALSLFLPTYAQEFSGRATYQSKMILKDFNEKAAENPSKISQDFIEAVKRASEKTFILEFTKEESLYTEEKTLELPTSTGKPKNRVIINTEDSGTLYKNLKENYSILENDRFNKTNLIKDTLETAGWELLTESKQIGNYTVYKATKTIKKEVSTQKEDREKTSNLLEMLDKKEPEDWVYVAWYTPQIPTPNGPGKFGGLSGLILELHDPRQETVYLCSEIVLNPKKPIEIKVPKGKTVSKEEFEKMRKEWLEKTAIRKY
ncbi:MAG TPA: GLPGLI family protein [Flavobacterium sp.]|nr:GLPGLI family protein [Flavobacterium sp.]